MESGRRGKRVYMNLGFDKFSEVAMKLSHNPLGIIALFICLVYAIAATVLVKSIEFLYPYESLLLLLFIVCFPLVILFVFYLNLLFCMMMYEKVCLLCLKYIFCQKSIHSRRLSASYAVFVRLAPHQRHEWIFPNSLSLICS